MGTDHEHRVCTYEEARNALLSRTELWVHDCYCRTPAKQGKAAWPYCGHRLDVCIGLRQWKDAPPGITQRPLTQASALELFDEWAGQGNFFRFMAGDAAVCFCCACGCGWFRDEQGNKVKDPCAKSPFIEKTDLSACTLCGKCAPVCAFGAREITDGKMIVHSEECYGCGACEFVCPEDAIVMVKRAGSPPSEAANGQ